jgi:transposase-like protein
MVEEAKVLIDEIQQLRTQYVAEVGRGRRVWPRSIKERIIRLDQLGLPAKIIADRTGVPNETIASWRHKVRHGLNKNFHVVTVQPEASATRSFPELSKSVAVTVPEDKIPSPPSTVFGSKALIVVTTPKGIRIEAAEPKAIIDILSGLAKGGELGTCF